MNTDYNPAPDDAAKGIYFPVAVPSTFTSAPFALTGRVVIGGWSLREGSGTQQCIVQLIDGGSAAGTVIADITLDPGQSIRDVCPGHGIEARTGLFINMVSGIVQGSVWVKEL